VVAAETFDITHRGDGDSIYGPLVSSYDIELSVLQAMQKWIHSYLTEVERRHEMAPNTWPRPRAWRITSDLERMPEDQLPAILVRSSGTAPERPEHTGEGLYRAQWRVEVGAQVAAKSVIVDDCVPLAVRNARLWALALRGVIVQQQDDRGIVGYWDWLGERYDVLDADADRTICMGVALIECDAFEVINRWAGPLEPIAPPEPPDPPVPSPVWPTATSKDIVIEKVPLDQNVKETP